METTFPPLDGGCDVVTCNMSLVYAYVCQNTILIWTCTSFLGSPFTHRSCAVGHLVEASRKAAVSNPDGLIGLLH